MEFEFDPAKSAANREKHGIDFIEAQVLWAVWALEVPVVWPGEPRFLRIAPLGGRVWVAVFTWRSGAIRIISVRRARGNERLAYDRENRDR
jgi:uncharacterized DUF497 family protein